MRRYSVRNLVQKHFYLGVHRDGIRAMFWGVVLRQFAATSVGLFVPIYVYLLGFSHYGNSMVSGIRTLIFFLITIRLSVILSSLFVESLVDRIGFRRTLLISSLFLAVKYLLLTFAEVDLIFLWMAAVISGIVAATYWIARHALFGEDQDVTSIGSSLGLIIVLARLAAIIGPITGGLVAAFFGFDWLFNLGLILAIASAIPYFFMKHHRRHHPDGIRGLLDKLKDRENWPLIFGWLGGSWDDVLSIDFWPVYIFLMVGGVGQLGILSSLVAVVSMITVYLSGWVFDKTDKRKEMFLLGTWLTAVFWPVKALARGFWSIFAVDSLHTVLGSFYSVPFLSLTYRFSFRRDTVAFFAFREIVWSVGILMFLLFGLMLTIYWSWMLLFLLGGIGVILSTKLISYRVFDRELR